MKDWFSPAEIVAAARGALPGTVRGLNRLAEREGWRMKGLARRRFGKGGGFEFHADALPGEIVARLAVMVPPEGPSPTPPHRGEGQKTELWARFEGLSARQKSVCEKRLKLLDEAAALAAAGMGETAAMRRVAAAAGVAVSTLANWKAMIAGVEVADRLAALAPGWTGSAARAAIDAAAWETLKSDYLRPERPAFSACFRRMQRTAARRGWNAPSERALRRRLDAEVPAEVQKLARDGRDAAWAMFPAQTRSRAHFTAMQAVNMDGHRLDVFAKRADGKIARPHLLALQDLFSGKIVAWRLAESENREAVRLVIGDMVERHGIPEAITLDNGRAFASKWISGGTPNRFRFKVRDEDPLGLLTSLGVTIAWASPHRGQSKPIERAFLDLVEEIARHPFCAGAYTGNAPDAKPENYASRAVEWQGLRGHVAARIAEHNARPGRTAETCKGRSFDETFAASLAAGAIVRRASEKQRSLWLLAAERIRASRGNGEIRLMENRYWAPALTGQAGRLVTVRFDPDDLAQPVLVYDDKGALVAEAERIDATGFNDATAARAHAKKRAAWLKAAAEQKRLHATMTAEELARLYAPGDPVGEAGAPREKVTRLVVNGSPTPATGWSAEQEENFTRGLRLVAGRDFSD